MHVSLSATFIYQVYSEGQWLQITFFFSFFIENGPYVHAYYLVRLKVDKYGGHFKLVYLHSERNCHFFKKTVS